MISAQLVSLIVMFVAGIFVGATIDMIRTVMTVSLHFKWIQKISYIIEWIFWASLGVLSFSLLLYIKNGHWRMIDPLAQIVGIFVYDVLLQPVARWVGRIVMYVVIRPFIKIGHFVVWAVRIWIMIGIKLMKFLCIPANFLYKNCKKHLLNK